MDRFDSQHGVSQIACHRMQQCVRFAHAWGFDTTDQRRDGNDAAGFSRLLYGWGTGGYPSIS